MNANSKPPEEKSPENGSPGENPRRRLLKGGLASGPVLLTLASRPVLGAVSCTTASAFTSLNNSGPGQSQTCSGKLPSYWTTPSTGWPSAYTKNGSHATLFISSTTGLNAGMTGTTYSSSTMVNVLGLSDSGGMQSLALYTATALLNAAALLTPVLTTATVRDMWNSCVSVGYYAPTSAVQWPPAQVVTYIKSTIG